MISRFLDWVTAELSDPAVKRGLLVVLGMLIFKIGLAYGLDQTRADVLASAIWSLVTVAVSRAPGKGSS